VKESADCGFLFDVDTTSLDNDPVRTDLNPHFAGVYGDAVRDRFWAIFEALRSHTKRP
jgi:hypothetical protein